MVKPHDCDYERVRIEPTTMILSPLVIVAREGDLFCDKKMKTKKNLRAANPKKRGEPEKSSKSKCSGAGAMT